MKKLLITIAALSALSTNAHAFGSKGACGGPSVEFSLERTLDNTNGYNSEIGGYHPNHETHRGAETFGSVTFTIPLFSGDLKDQCEAKTLQDRNEARKIKAEAEEAEQEANEQKIRNLRDKIKICGQFKLEDAPGSIKTFCGDLLQ